MTAIVFSLRRAGYHIERMTLSYRTITSPVGAVHDRDSVQLAQGRLSTSSAWRSPTGMALSCRYTTWY